jgi:hypothetical protein
MLSQIFFKIRSRFRTDVSLGNPVTDHAATIVPVTCHILRHSPSHVRRPILGASVTSHVTPPYRV